MVRQQCPSAHARQSRLRAVGARLAEILALRRIDRRNRRSDTGSRRSCKSSVRDVNSRDPNAETSSSRGQHREQLGDLLYSESCAEQGDGWEYSCSRPFFPERGENKARAFRIEPPSRLSADYAWSHSDADFALRVVTVEQVLHDFGWPFQSLMSVVGCRWKCPADHARTGEPRANRQVAQ